jgi:amidase
MDRREFLSVAAALSTMAKVQPQSTSASTTHHPSQNEICFADATELARLLRSRAVSAVEVMQACQAQIERLNPKVNAICTLVDEEHLMQQARVADARLAKGGAIGALHGFPHAVKDLVPTAGIRTTYGSPIYKDNVPSDDALIVQRLKSAGAIIIGKTNTPEFGAGSQTFNRVFGVTRNPYDLTRTCGGSSGGAAVSVACGMTPLADGSDHGGSLRNPPSFCNVVGFRPSIGRVPAWPKAQPWTSMSVEGPIARSVRDVALLLSVVAGPDPRSPIAIDEPGSIFRGRLRRDFKGVRIAWSRNLGTYPVEPVVNQVCDAARHVFADLGCRVEDGQPDFSDADEVFQALRAWSFAQDRGDDFARHRDLMKDTVVWNIEQGLKLTGVDVSAAEAKRAALFQRVRAFLERFEFLVLPVSQVAPFPADVEWVREINGVKMNTYIDWMATCYAITLTGLPAVSVPCGFTPDGLPIGLLIVGRPRRDLDVLKLAYAFEQATEFAKRRPPLAG